MATRRTEGGVPAAESACGQGPCFRGRVCLRAGAVFPRPSLPAGRDFGPVRTYGAFPPAAARQAPPVHEATGGYAVRSPCPSGIPRPRHKALSMVLQRFLSLVLKRFLSLVLQRFLSLVLHRFLISSPDLRIDARFSRFTRSCVHRFLISSPNLRIDARFSPFTRSFVHRFLISGPNLRITAGFRLQRLLQQRTFASNSNFRRVKEEWPACCDRSGDDVPRPILIFIAA